MKQITWADVAPGDTIQVSTGLRWTVIETTGEGQVGMTRDGLTSFGKPDPRGAVTLIDRPCIDGMTEAATGVVTTLLGASVVADKSGGRWKVPKTIAGLGDFRTHLFMLHGTHGGDLKTRKAIEAVHRQSHEDHLAGTPLPAYQDHEHTDEPFRGR